MAIQTQFCVALPQSGVHRRSICRLHEVFTAAPRTLITELFAAGLPDGTPEIRRQRVVASRTSNRD